jgi:lysine-ketoglutarate reductase/saccharopine dehydrogenase-like protein (TIGR00300 family)
MSEHSQDNAGSDKNLATDEARILAASVVTERVEVQGHILDSLLLPKILDLITSNGGRFVITEMSVGQAATDASYALLDLATDSVEQMEAVLAAIEVHGAAPIETVDARLEAVDIEGALPEGFYSTTNHRSEIRIDGDWVPVQDQEMDCGIVVDPVLNTARCKPMCDAELGERFVVGHLGVRIFAESTSESGQGFEFMNSAVSSEKPKQVAVRRVAEQLFQARQEGKKTLIVGGPAIIHTGSGEHLETLIRDGYVDLLFAGNALATHDIEHAMFGTSLGVRLACGEIVEAGHEHHLRAINRIRRAGGIRPAVENGILSSGVMYQCVKNDVDYLLAGSIRDDGPLPDVETDAIEAQRQMRKKIRDLSFCLMIATTLHSIAVGNLLPASVGVVCVDINPSTVIKLSDRGSSQTVGVVTDVEPFMRALVAELQRMSAPAGSTGV